MSFTIKPVQAFLEKDLDTFSKMDPYVKITVGGKKYKSRTHKNGGKNPAWSDVFEISATSDKLMKIELWDQDVLNDDFIGDGYFNLQQLMNMPGKTENQYVDLNRYGKKFGRILLSMVYNAPRNQGWSGNQAQNSWGNQNTWNTSPKNNWNTNQIQGWGNFTPTNWNTSPRNNWQNQPQYAQQNQYPQQTQYSQQQNYNPNMTPQQGSLWQNVKPIVGGTLLSQNIISNNPNIPSYSNQNGGWNYPSNNNNGW